MTEDTVQKNFNVIIKSLEDISTTIGPIMPLAKQSNDLTIALLITYKKAWRNMKS